MNHFEETVEKIRTLARCGDVTTAIESIGAIGDRQAAPLLRDLTADAMMLDSYTRDALARALGKLGGDEAIDGLRRLLGCGDSLVVSTVVTVLCDLSMSEPKARALLDQHAHQRGGLV